MSEFGDLTFTIQNVVIQEKEIILVHEKDHTDEGGRRAGWNLFGGNTEGWSIERTYRQIINFLPVERIPEQDFLNLLGIRLDDDFFSWLWNHKDYKKFMPEIGQLIFLTAIREGIEETGLLVKPKFILFEERTASENHHLLVAHSEIVSGTIQKRSLETDDCGWFDLRALPEGIYHSHRRRIALAVYKLGIRDKESGQLLNLFA